MVEKQTKHLVKTETGVLGIDLMPQNVAKNIKKDNLLIYDLGWWQEFLGSSENLQLSRRTQTISLVTNVAGMKFRLS